MSLTAIQEALRVVGQKVFDPLQPIQHCLGDDTPSLSTSALEPSSVTYCIDVLIEVNGYRAG